MISDVIGKLVILKCSLLIQTYKMSIKSLKKDFYFQNLTDFSLSPPP